MPGTASFDVFCVKICWGVLAVRDFLNPKNSRVGLNNLVREVAHARKQNPLPYLDEILHNLDILDIITCAKFGESRLRGFGVVEGQICPSPLTLIVAPVRVCM